MSAFGLALVILGCVLNIFITVARERSSNKPWYKNLVLILGVVSLLLVAAIAITTYRENKQSKQQATHQAEVLNAEIGTLRDQNRALGDKIGDCNARIEAVTTKLHAPAHLKRGFSETLKLTDSVSVEKNKK